MRAQFDGTLWPLLAAEATKKRGHEVFPQRPPAKKKRVAYETPAAGPSRAMQDGAPVSTKKQT